MRELEDLAVTPGAEAGDAEDTEGGDNYGKAEARAKGKKKKKGRRNGLDDDGLDDEGAANDEDGALSLTRRGLAATGTCRNAYRSTANSYR